MYYIYTMQCARWHYVGRTTRTDTAAFVRLELAKRGFQVEIFADGTVEFEAPCRVTATRRR